MDFDRLTTRDVPILPDHTALLFIDVQNFSAHRDGGEFKNMSGEDVSAHYGWFFDRIERETLANMTKLQAVCRNTGIEVMYAVIESLTKDGRDRSLDYRITGFNVSKGSWDAQVHDAIKPLEDEIIFSKTSSNVFVSTNIDYVLRNLGVRQLVISGFITDQCISSAVRDACDLGYLVTLASDACATYTPTRHEDAIKSLAGYCRLMTTDEICDELNESKNILSPRTEASWTKRI
ncbi:MAG: cysteine hydrolase [Amylibacter sp.]|nr:cysteine hydrolase [Amylibacter sp.]